VEGATRLPPDRIDEVLAPFVGPERTIADLQQARAALESAYADRGYGATQVVLPEQEIKDGIVRLRVVEGKVGRILIEGNRFFDERSSTSFDQGPTRAIPSPGST
jgi:hemolysin activation/secretion protein